MSHANKQAMLQRDRRIRRRLLSILHEARANDSGGWLSGRFIMDVVTAYLPPADRPTDDQHLLALLRDLSNKGFASERDDRDRKLQPFGLDYLSFVVRFNGSSLICESIPPDPDIEDDRIA